MENIILDRKCFIRDKNNLAYCSKCGQRQLQDGYNITRHANECGFTSKDFYRIMKEDSDYAYAFKINGNKLYFVVTTPNLVLLEGTKDRYSRGTWKEVFRATFTKGSKVVEEKGLYNIDFWFKHYLDKKRMPCLNKDESIDFLREFFSDIIFIDSFGAFLDIYRNKGFSSKKLLTDEEVKEVLSREIEGRKPRGSTYVVNGELLEIHDELVLHIEIKNATEIIRCLVSGQYAYTDTNTDFLRELILKNAHPVQNFISDEDISRFDKKYPNFMLEHYLDIGGKNILIPLFSGNYNKCIELLYKAELPAIAEAFNEIKENNNLILYKNNIKEIFGLPVKTFKRLVTNVGLYQKGLFDILRSVYEYDKTILDIDCLMPASFQFLKENDITHTMSQRTYYSIRGVDKWSSTDIKEALKYLNKLEKTRAPFGPYSIYGIYRDYIECCILLGDFVDGKFPKNLIESHNKVNMMAQVKKDALVDKAFRRNVKEYGFLGSEYGDEAEEFEDDKYAILAPNNPMDLFSESSQLHHCVKTYVERVARGDTYILFLREKNNKKKSFATIEVLPNMTLVQLKAVNNSKAPLTAQEFVRKWAKIKKIKIDTYDM